MPGVWSGVVAGKKPNTGPAYNPGLNSSGLWVPPRYSSHNSGSSNSPQSLSRTNTPSPQSGTPSPGSQDWPQLYSGHLPVILPSKSQPTMVSHNQSTIPMGQPISEEPVEVKDEAGLYLVPARQSDEICLHDGRDMYRRRTSSNTSQDEPLPLLTPRQRADSGGSTGGRLPQVHFTVDSDDDDDGMGSMNSDSDSALNGSTYKVNLCANCKQHAHASQVTSPPSSRGHSQKKHGGGTPRGGTHSWGPKIGYTGHRRYSVPTKLNQNADRSPHYSDGRRNVDQDQSQQGSGGGNGSKQLKGRGKTQYRHRGAAEKTKGHHLQQSISEPATRKSTGCSNPAKCGSRSSYRRVKSAGHSFNRSSSMSSEDGSLKKIGGPTTATRVAGGASHSPKDNGRLFTHREVNVGQEQVSPDQQTRTEQDASFGRQHRPKAQAPSQRKQLRVQGQWNEGSMSHQSSQNIPQSSKDSATIHGGNPKWTWKH